LARHWNPSPKSGMDAQLIACILESAAINDMAALHVLHQQYMDGVDDAFSTERGLGASLAAGHTDLMDLLLTMSPSQLLPASPTQLGHMWLAAAMSGAPAPLERMRQVFGGEVPPDSSTAPFLNALYGMAPMDSVHWVRGALRLPALSAEHLRGCTRAGRVDVLRLVLGEAPPAGEQQQRQQQEEEEEQLADLLLTCTISAPVFPLELATLLCRGDLCPGRLPAVSEAGRTAATCLAAGRPAALRFLLRAQNTPWPAYLLPAFAAAGEDASLECLLDALPLAFPETPHCDDVQYALSVALGHVQFRSRSARSLKRRPRFETAAQLRVAADAVAKSAAAFSCLERRIENARAAASGCAAAAEVRPHKRRLRWEDEEQELEEQEPKRTATTAV